MRSTPVTVSPRSEPIAGDGVLVVDKPDGPTSQRVVTIVKRSLGVRKAGHTGTLDPFATGVLPVCLGRATKLATWLTGSDKTYRARMRLGVTTDTLDRTGTVTGERDATGVSRDALEAALASFRGIIQQVPPMYSAVKIDGKRLYEHARKGREVKREPREVTIHELELEALEGVTAVVRVVCSKGTYVRTLVADLGEALGVGAHVLELRRTASGDFAESLSVPLEVVRSSPEEARAHLIGLDEVPLPMPSVSVDPAIAERVGHGAPIRLPDAPEGPFAVRDAEGRLLAVAERADGGRIRILRGI